MDPGLLQTILRDFVAPPLVAAAMGYGGAVLRFRRTLSADRVALQKTFEEAKSKIEQDFARAREKLEEEFADLKLSIAQGVEQEVTELKTKFEVEITNAKSKARELEDAVDDLREKSGDYTSEQKSAEFYTRVSTWMERTNRSFGRIEGALFRAIGRTPSPYPSDPPHPPPRPPGGSTRR